MNTTKNNPLPKDVIYKHHYEESLDLYRTINTEGTIISCNKSYAESLGYDIDDVIGTSIFEHVDAKNKQAMKKTFEQWLKTGVVTNNEVWLKRKDGSTFPCLISVSNLYDDEKNLIGSNTVIRDITEIYEVKREIADLKEKRLAVVGELSARVAHDLRNPLGIIRGCLEIIESKSDLSPEDMTKYSDRMNRAISRMSHQIDEVLDYVKPKALVLKSNSVRKIITSTISKIPSYEDVTISVDGDITINCDLEKLEIVFTNLIQNAIQAMNSMGEINIKIHQDKDNAIIEVKDSGPGIPAELIGKIFDPLFTTRQIGTGLGLPSCKAIVEKHQGKIEVQSAVGKGTVFVISIPTNLSN